ncbi:hypothetical protein J6590_070346 [Homalodisca vitripennis]|nr:hypothetical protein J6590_070346 [Homalodisca vitripennis]
MPLLWAATTFRPRKGDCAQRVASVTMLLWVVGGAATTFQPRKGDCAAASGECYYFIVVGCDHIPRKEGRLCCIEWRVLLCRCCGLRPHSGQGRATVLERVASVTMSLLWVCGHTPAKVTATTHVTESR